METNDLIKEIFFIIIAALFLGLILAAKISWTKIIIEPLNILWMFLFSLLMLSVFVMSQKTMAWALDCKIKTKLLTFRRYWFQPLTRESKAEFPFDFPLWLILPLILVFATNGFLKWLAILDFDIEPKPTKIRRRWKELTEDDVGKIAIVGPISVLILSLLLNIFGFASLAVACSWLAFLSLMPIGAGFKLFNSSRIVWLFTFIFALFILVLTNLITAFATIIIALLIAAIITIAYYILYE